MGWLAFIWGPYQLIEGNLLSAKLWSAASQFEGIGKLIAIIGLGGFAAVKFGRGVRRRYNAFRVEIEQAERKKQQVEEEQAHRSISLGTTTEEDEGEMSYLRRNSEDDDESGEEEEDIFVCD
jgi:hypothetical protein